MIVNPWEVKGEIDYNKLIEKFGTKKIDEELKKEIFKIANEDNVLLRRNFFFSHRDLNLILKDYKEGKGFFLYTGRGPSGKMHLGHLIPLLFTKWLQKVFDVNLYIEITDDEKYWVKNIGWDEIQKYAYDNILDIIALGFDKDKTFIFKDSEYIKKIYPMLIKISKKINFNKTRAVFGFNNETPIGLIFYPAYQIAPTFFEKKRALIPCAIDQDPYWRIQRDIAEQFGFYKTAAIHSKFLPPLTGVKGKMSSSEGMAIWLDDDKKTVKKKINKYAFSGGKETIEEHRKYGGNPEVDVAYKWLEIFFEPSDKKLRKIYDDYKAGALLSGELKAILIEKINNFLEKHQENKEKAKDLVDEFLYSGKLAEKMWL